MKKREDMKRQKTSLILLGLLFLLKLNAQQVALPPAPEAAAMKEYVDVPVNMYSGIPQMSIPIHAIQGREITVPITLSYHANGIRVAEEASWVGLGWNLSAGGMITREIRDNDDFGEINFWDGGNQLSLPYATTVGKLPKDPSYTSENQFIYHDDRTTSATLDNCDGTQDDYCNYETIDGSTGVKQDFCGETFSNLDPNSNLRRIDTEPDLFTFSFGGYSGKFIYDKKTGQYIPMSSQAISIEMPGTNEEPYWIVSTPDGKKYFFGETTLGRQLHYSLSYTLQSNGRGEDELGDPTCSNCFSQPDDQPKRSYISTWYLQRIEAPNGDKVDFIYEKDPVIYLDGFVKENKSGITPVPNYSDHMEDRLMACQEFIEAITFKSIYPLGCLSPPLPITKEILNRTITRTAYDRVTLAEIRGEYGKIAFKTRDRLDLLGGERLNAIEIYTGIDESNLSLNKKFEFKYGYFDSSNKLQPALNDWRGHISSAFVSIIPSNFSSAHYNKRLKLESVQEIGSDDAFIPPYSFTYFEGSNLGIDQTLPPKSSFAVDIWGYHNDAKDNRLLLPDLRIEAGRLQELLTRFDDISRCSSPGQKLPTFKGANRETSKSHVGGWLLKGVEYPTGGKLEMDYEANEYAIPPTWKKKNQGSSVTLGIDEGSLDFIWENTLSVSTDRPNAQSPIDATLYVGYFLSYDEDNPCSPCPIADFENGSRKLPYIRITPTDNSTPSQVIGEGDMVVGDAQRLMPLCTGEGLNEGECGYEGPMVVKNVSLIPGKSYNIELYVTEPCLYRQVPCDLVEFQVTIEWDEYELIDRETGGGMRIKQSDLDDGRDKNITKLYKYPLINSEGGMGGKLLNKPTFEYEYYTIYPGGTFCNGQIPFTTTLESHRYSNSQVPLQSGYAGSFVGYTEVEVWQGEEKENGWSWYKFHNEPTEYSFGANAEPPNYSRYYDQQNGSLLEQIDYLEDSNQKVRSVKNSYQNEFLDQFWSLNLFTFSDPTSWGGSPGVSTDLPGQEPGNFPAQLFCPENSNLFYFYNDVRQWVKLLKTEETFHFEGGGVTKVTDFTYNNENFQIASSALTDSDNRVYTTTYEYPEGSEISEADIESTAILLSELNIISTVIAERTLVDDGTQTGGIKTTYQIAGGAIVPETLFQWEGNAWDPIGTFTAYYADGFPRTFQREYYNDPDEFEWFGYGSLSDELEKKGLLAKKTYKDFKWEFDYHIGNRRLAKKIEVDQTYAEFAYDGLQRLNTIQTFGQSAAPKSTATKKYSYGGPDNNTVGTEVEYETDPQSNLTAEPKKSTKYFDGLGRFYKTVMHKYHEGVNDVTTEELVFDEFGRVEEKVYLPGSWTTLKYEHSPLNRLIEEKFPDGKKIMLEYGAAENYFTNTMIDEKGNMTITQTDLLGRTAQVTDAESGILQYTYDIWGNIEMITTPGRQQYSYGYDSQNRLISKTIPGGGTTTYGYEDPSEPENGRDLLVWQQFAKDQNNENIKISFRYDDYDRVIETFKGNLDAELLTKNQYYEEPGEHIDKIEWTENKNIGEEGYTRDTYTYDQFGRAENYKFKHLIAVDETVNSYDLADRVRKTALSHNGYKVVEVITENEYDNYDRLLTSHHNVDGLGPELITDNKEYNKRGELVTKEMGDGLQVFNYQYHERGWLTQINKPLEGFGELGLSCVLPNLEDDDNTLEDDDNFYVDILRIEELLKLRFEVQFKIQEEFDDGPCPEPECPEPECTSEEVEQQNVCLAEIKELTKEVLGRTDSVACEDGTTEEVWTIDITSISFPLDLIRVSLCDGTEIYILASYAEKLCGNYIIEQLIPVQSEGQLFSAANPNLPTTLDLEEVLTLIVDGETPNLNGYQDCEKQICRSTPPDCSAAIIALQKASIEALKRLVPDISADDLPIRLLDMLTCTGETFYILEEEYGIVEHTEMEVIDTILIDSLTQPIPVKYENPKTLPDCADLFYLKLDYEANGNIKSKTWQVANRNEMKYIFSYDKLNRLKTAKYSERMKVPQATVDEGGESYITAGYSTMTDDRYGVPLISYDADGNIEFLKRNGIVGECRPGVPEFGQIDNLAYAYDHASAPNRLKSIVDYTGEENGFNPGGATGDYDYDEKGNLIYDPYKNLTIEYSYLNLPLKITKGGGTINTVYDAAGRKLRQEFIPEEGEGSLVDYISGIEYRDEELNSVYHAEGRVFQEDEKWQYEYFIKDHLGNTRLVVSDLNGDGCIDPLSDPSEILQENHYYPFGLNMDGPWAAQYQLEETDQNGNGILDPVLDEEGNPVVDQDRLNRYQYNGKELTEDLGLNWNDYGARWYDPAIGRFPGVDPIIEKFPHLTPYNYASNSPITNIDLWGLQGWPANELKGKAVGLLNYLFGTNIKAQGKPNTTPRRYISVKGEATGKAVVGFGLGVKANVLGVKGEVEADIGSLKLVEVNASTEDGFEGHLIGAGGEVRTERGGAAMIELGGGQVKVGGEIEAERSTVNGETTSATQTTKLGVEVQGKVYGYENTSEVVVGSDGKPKSVIPDTKQTSFSIGLGFQMIIGAEGKLKITFSSSVKKPEQNE